MPKVKVCKSITIDGRCLEPSFKNVYCKSHTKQCKVFLKDYKNICNKVWSEKCTDDNSIADLDNIIDSASMCMYSRMKYADTCCKGTYDAGHLGAIKKMNNLVNKCKDIKDEKLSNERKIDIAPPAIEKKMDLSSALQFKDFIPPGFEDFVPTLDGRRRKLDENIRERERMEEERERRQEEKRREYERMEEERRRRQEERERRQEGIRREADVRSKRIKRVEKYLEGKEKELDRMEKELERRERRLAEERRKLGLEM